MEIKINGETLWIRTMEDLYKYLSMMSDEEFVNWAALIAYSPAPDEPIGFFRKRVVDSVERTGHY